MNSPILENIIKHLGSIEELQKENDKLKELQKENDKLKTRFKELIDGSYTDKFYYCDEEDCGNILEECDRYFICDCCCSYDPTICVQCIDKTDLLIHYKPLDKDENDDWDACICYECYENDKEKENFQKEFLIINKGFLKATKEEK